MKNLSVSYAAVLAIFAMAAVATPADAKTSKGKQQYLQIKLQDATISSARTKPASTPSSTGKPEERCGRVERIGKRRRGKGAQRRAHAPTSITRSRLRRAPSDSVVFFSEISQCRAALFD